ncbi:tetratricopeptide repeat protein [Entomospira entomophila]|uniref:Tetratricopeptide repeat protein n=1 Tax=Entomospira entomophila TaxID=2719988 RepID=A0A968GD15_9SPIO|nr:tetratricopeptide repeat protein [Entomospira entomophilus]NIZ40734.1 tetratricopeptide repeat protein [Entomospira entomophilus]WDI34947.1 tetratricopeptide repeat protein [Entomospira entomophilus]
MKRTGIILFICISLSQHIFALDWIDEHLDDSHIVNNDKEEVPSAVGLPLQSDLEAEKEGKNDEIVLPDDIEEPRSETQKVEIVENKHSKHKAFLIDFSQAELQHAQTLESLSLSTQAHAAYNRAIDVAAVKGRESLLQAILARAGFYLRHRDLDGAESDYRAAMELVDIERRYSLAEYVAGVYAQQGFWEESLPWYSRKIGADPKSVSGYTERAYAYVKLNRYRTALLDYDVALSLTDDASTKARIEFEKAKLYFALGDKERADLSFSRSPQTATHLRIRAEFYRSENRVNEAIEAYAKLINQNPQTASEHALYAEWLALQGRVDEAQKEFEKAVALAPQDPSIVARRAHFFMEQQEFDLALQDYTRAINLDIDAAHRYADRARLLDKMKAYDLAIADFSRAIDLEPTRAFRYNERAGSYRRRGQVQLALNDYAQALRLDPGNVTAQRGWSELQHQR